ncbi:membrane protein [Streptomyces olindensis]|nr:membrane protein [Streptomyces olindensis]
MRSVPLWALVSSGCAPVVLIMGWLVAASLQGSAYDPAAQTISVLAAPGGSGYWVMTAAFIALGVCHLVTAWGLRPAAPAGRVALAAGGGSALAVALVPAPSSGGSLSHGSVAAVGFVLLAAWPVLASRSGDTVPWALRPLPALGATAVMALGATWFLIELHQRGAAGAAERAVTTIQSVWPFVVVLSCFQRSAREGYPV